jgi:hypothetical protein
MVPERRANVVLEYIDLGLVIVEVGCQALVRLLVICPEV